MSENQTIQELLTKAKQRDIEAAKEILRRISDKMYFITRLYVADHEQARKVEQAGLKKVFSNLKEVTNSNGLSAGQQKLFVRKLLPTYYH